MQTVNKQEKLLSWFCNMRNNKCHIKLLVSRLENRANEIK